MPPSVRITEERSDPQTNQFDGAPDSFNRVKTASVAPKQIRLLDSHTINQIAAGEVVERPAAIVKELVENSIDAGADLIEIEIKAAGRELVRVSDNGCGMNREGLLSCLQRHATSKITSADDLRRIDSLGFRGEAIPSIASVSRMRLSSSESDGARTVVVLDAGTLKKEEAASGPRGTEVTVESLFFNLPVRMKFMRTDTTEQSACVEAASKYALAYPHIRFIFRNEHSTLLETSGSGDPLTAIAEVWGRDMARALVPVESFVAGVRVRGFCSPPHLTKPIRSMQQVFVNGRPVKARTVYAAIDSAYKSLTPERRFPAVVLFLDVDPARVDANVSPTKSEVKFQGEGAVFDAVRLALKTALLESGMVPDLADIARANEALAGKQSDFGLGILDFISAETAGLRLTEFVGNSSSGSELSKTIQGDSEMPVSSNPHLTTLDSEISSIQTLRSSISNPDFVLANTNQPFASLADGLRVLGQIMLTFIVCETKSGLAIIDQHVAHERVLYEYLCGMRGRVPVERQSLLSPEAVPVERRVAPILFERVGDLAALGYDCEPFGDDSLLVRAVPAALSGKDAFRALRDVLDELAEGGLGPKPAREKIWIMCSCKMAVKAGDRLTIAEMEKLILDLAATENPYLCPHGRPITVTLGAHDLLRKFGRV